MTKRELIRLMAKDAGIPIAKAERALNSILMNIGSTLKKKNGKVSLTNFGTFSKVRRKARIGRNPRTGNQIKITASNTVKFKAASTLKNSIKPPTEDTGPRRK